MILGNTCQVIYLGYVSFSCRTSCSLSIGKLALWVVLMILSTLKYLTNLV
uniref:Uncharacterized protein n=1 Tax=Arundo donax TaxID=35708 RepID=A0A0A9E236_ARUDO